MQLTKGVQQILAYIFGVVFLITIIVIAFRVPEPTSFQYVVFRVTLALAAAGVVAMIPGFINVQVSTLVRAGGAVAVFVIVYLIHPPGDVIDDEPIPLPENLIEMVKIDSTFAISKYEITNKQYAEFSEDKIHNTALENPVSNVSWHDAMGFCHWLSEKTGKNYTLPTVAQWYKAAGCDEGANYPWGNNLPDKNMANYSRIYGDKTVSVKSLASGASKYGVMHMAGNVAEWTLEDLDGKSERKIILGGSWYHDVSYMKCLNKHLENLPPNTRKEYIGFRVVEIFD